MEVILAENRPEFLSSLKERVELVVIPLLNYLQEAEKRLAPAWEQLLANLKEKLPEGLIPLELIIDPQRESLYRVCLRFGLMFSTNTKKIRRAYKKVRRQFTPLMAGDLIHF